MDKTLWIIPTAAVGFNARSGPARFKELLSGEVVKRDAEVRSLHEPNQPFFST